MLDLHSDLERLSLPSTKVADTLLRIGSHSSAKDKYIEVASDILGPSFGFPFLAENGAISTTYGSLPDDKIADVMACCNGLAQCEKKLGNTEKALLWLEEVRIIYLNVRTFRQPKLYDWQDWFPDTTAISVQYAKAAALVGVLFKDLGNTGTAVHRRWTTESLIPSIHRTREPAIERTILAQDTTRTLIQFRHPDPSMVHRSTVVDPSLQVLGSWKKLKVKKSAGPGRRMGFSGFIWDGHLYIAGGRRDSLGPFYRDMFALDLAKLDAWKVMPAYPQPQSRTSAFLGWHMIPCVEHKKAYLFTGRPTLDYFDLTTKTWGSVNTKFLRHDPEDTASGIRKAWPYPGSVLTDSTQQIFEEKLYVFGGTHSETNIGCNLFMVLDLKTYTWTRLSGHVMAPKDADGTPGPRKTPSSWIDGPSKKFCLLFGECDRMGASLKGELHGSDCGYAFDDFWTWDIANGKWSRERFSGNAPCARSETACVYHPVLDKTIIWGGYNPDLPTVFYENGTTFGFSYYADTFICDISPRADSDAGAGTRAGAGTGTGAVARSATPRKWQQVITKGFPTYRAQSQLLVDPQSGRTYLFGGFTNNDYVPSRKTAISRSFGDVWELRVDLPGGHFEGVDVEDEVRTAQAGPWNRCFTCGSAGPWRKCGGSCRGRAFFCDADCLKEGWKEHKTVHGCHKVD